MVTAALAIARDMPIPEGDTRIKKSLVKAFLVRMSAICLEYAAASSSISSADFMVQKTLNLAKTMG
ncbi:MAG: hypothetical protein M3270_11905 [Thermoproteota archaeon]|nr:hypothetical protein [Thermoproteota archaeon]